MIDSSFVEIVFASSSRTFGWVALGILSAAVVIGAIAILVRLHHSPLPAAARFWMDVTWLYCRVWFRLKNENPCTVPAKGGAVIVANHTCAVDPLLLLAGYNQRPVGYMIAREYSNVPVGRYFIRLIECIPVKRDLMDAAAVKAALRHLKSGKVLGIFIEGRIVPPGEEADPREGPAMLALRSGVVIVPAHISGTIYDASVARSFARRHRARIRWGQPIDLAAMYGSHRQDKETLRAISQMLMDTIREVGREPDAGRSEVVH